MHRHLPADSQLIADLRATALAALSLVLLCVLACDAVSALAQSAAPPGTAGPAFTTQSTVVIVPALVRTRSGAMVYTLLAGDFVLKDDGVPQKLTLEPETGSEPLALVVVVEIGGAGARQFEKYDSIVPPLAPMLASIVGNIPRQIAVVTFDSHPALLQDFTGNVETAAGALRTLRPGCTREHHMDNCESPNAVHNIPLGNNGAAILDSLEYAVDLLRTKPVGYRRAILLISETLDRGSQTTVEEAVRSTTDTNTIIYSVGFSTAKSEAAHYAARQLPTQPSGRPSGLLSLENHHPNPPHGCMGKDPDPDPDGPRNRWEQAYDCLAQLAPPLTFAKMAAIATVDGLQRNIPETVAHLTGGEYFKLTDAKSLERDLATIANHLPNRYVLSFHPLAPHAGLHEITLSVPNYTGLEVTARTRYWADPPASASPGR
jgi:VWFA-related protein